MPQSADNDADDKGAEFMDSSGADRGSRSASGPVIFAAATAPERRACANSGLKTDPVATPLFLRTGIGARGTEVLVDAAKRQTASGLISAGTAGGLAPNLGAGTILLPRRVRRTDGTIFEAASAWHTRVHAALIEHLPVNTDDLLEVDAVVRHPRDKRALHEKTQAGGVDMESGALAQAAIDIGTPYLVLRAVMDTADDEIPAAAIAGLTEAGEVNLMALLAYLLWHPGDLPGLVKTRRRFRTAADALSQACRLAAGPLVNPG